MDWRRLLIVAVAACGNDGTVSIQIETHDPAITRVELFVAASDCGDCDGIAPPSSLDHTKGKVHLIDSDVRFVAPVKDHIAGFRLQPDPVTSSVVPRLAAVGFDANDNPLGYVVDDAGFDVEKLIGQERRYELTSRTIVESQGALPGVAPTAPDPAMLVVAWRAPKTGENADPATRASCLAIETGNDSTTEFFVPPDDPDCDGIVADECDAHFYDFADPSATPTACLTREQGICQIGAAPACVDGGNHQCVSGGQFCVPDAACAVCSPPFDDQVCLTKLSDSNVMASRLHCRVPFYVDMISGNTTTCNAVTTPNALDLTRAVPGGGCKTNFATLAGGASNTKIAIDVPGSGSGEIQIAGGAPCAPELAPAFDFGVALGPPTNTTVVGAGVFVVTATSAGSRKVLLPVAATFVKIGGLQLCDALNTQVLMTCTVEQPSDSVWGCTHN